MSQVAMAVARAPDGVHDSRLITLWVSLKASSHTQRAYAAEADRFRDFVGKPLALVTLMDVQGAE
jgi:hypothetical protein